MRQKPKLFWFAVGKRNQFGITLNVGSVPTLKLHSCQLVLTLLYLDILPVITLNRKHKYYGH